MPLHVRKETTRYREMNVEIFGIDIDMNARDVAKNAIESISFGRLHRQSSSAMYI
jgi:hypothetical protein